MYESEIPLTCGFIVDPPCHTDWVTFLDTVTELEHRMCP
jgi:hypothetical protein